MQTIEGLRLNNLCAQGAYSGVYWNDASFEELSYVTGADSAEMGQGGMRVNMVPRDGANQFRGQIMGNYAGEWGADNCGSAGIGQPCDRSNLSGSTTFNQNNFLTNVSEIQKIWDVNPSIGGPILRDRLWFNYTFRHQGVEKTKANSYADLNPSQFAYEPDFSNPGIDDGHIVSNAVRVSWAISGKDKLSVYHDNQRKYRDHWGINANIASAGRDCNSGHSDQLRERIEVDAYAHQSFAARSWLRHLQPGIHRAVSAGRHWSRRQGVGPRTRFGDRPSTT